MRKEDDKQYVSSIDKVETLLNLLQEPTSADLSIEGRLRANLLLKYDELYNTVPHVISTPDSVSPTPKSMEFFQRSSTVQSLLERFLFTRPWQVLLPVSFSLSIVLRLIMANNFPKMVSLLLGMGAF